MSKSFKKIASIGLSVSTAVYLFGATAIPAGAQTTADLQAMINSLLTQINALQSQLAAQSGGAPASSYNFTRSLTVGSTGADVKALQQWLNANGYAVSASGAGSPGNESQYFGPATRAALARYQAAVGIAPAAGYFGPITRNRLAQAGGGTIPPAGIPTGALSVSVAGPIGGTVPSGSLYNQVLKLAFNGGATGGSVSSITVTRGGFISNTRITGISAWDDSGVRYGNIVSSLTSEGKATLSFGSNPFVVPAGQVKYVTISVNLDTTATSASMNFAVNAVTDVVAVGGAAVSGAFPLVGPSITVVDGSNSLGDVRVSDVAVSGTNLTNAQLSSYDGNVEIGDMAREVAKIRLSQNNSKEAIQLRTLVLYVSGSLQETSDVTNWQLVSPEGNVLATTQRPIDRYVTFTLASPYMIDKGLSKDFTVKADIADGSGRYFTVYVQNDYDILVRGVNSGAYPILTDGSGGSFTSADTQVNVASAYFKMKSGGLTVSKTTTSPSGSSIPPSSQNVVLAEFSLKSSGEQLEIRKMGVQVAYAGVTLAGSVTVKDKTTGENYLSIAADTAGISTTTAVTSSTLLTYQQNLSSYITIASGQTKTIQILGTIGSTATSSSNYTVNVGQFYAKRFSTNDFTTIAAGPYTGNQLTVGDVGLTIVKSSSFPNTNRSAGSVNAKIGEFTFQASSADDVRMSSIAFDVTTSTNLQNMVLKDEAGNQLGNTIGTPSATGNSYSVNLTIGKSATKTLSVYADILSSATTTSVISVASAGVSGYGVASGKALSSTPSSAVAGQTITMATPTLTIAADSGTPASKIVLAGTNGVELSRIKFSPVAESMTLSKITLQLASASTTVWNSTSNIAANLGTVYLYKTDNSLVGSASIVSGDTSADATFSGLNFALAQDADTVLVVKANINAQDAITPKSVFKVQVKSSSTDDMTVNKSSGGQLTTGITLTSNAASNFVLAHAAAPSVTNFYTTQQTGQIGSASEIGRFVFSNPGSREITLATSTFLVSLSGSGNSTVTGFQFAEAGDTGTKFAGAGTVSTTTPSASVPFVPTSNNTIAAGGSRTFIVYASTSLIRSGVTSGDVYLTVSMEGSKGYLASDVAGPDELFWNDSTFFYSYTTTGAGATTYSSNAASDSVPVSGISFRY